MTMHLTMYSRPVAAALAAACAGILLPLAGSAQSLVDDQPRSIAVSFETAALQTPAGANAVYERLARAANSVCDDYDDLLDFEQHSRLRECRTEALADAVASVHDPLLTAAYRAHQPTRLMAANERTLRRQAG
jgi:UrcA family protein